MSNRVNAVRHHVSQNVVFDVVRVVPLPEVDVDLFDGVELREVLRSVRVVGLSSSRTLSNGNTVTGSQLRAFARTVHNARV